MGILYTVYKDDPFSLTHAVGTHSHSNGVSNDQAVLCAKLKPVGESLLAG